MPTVAFAMEWVPQYRVPFYAALRDRLACDGIEMRLVHGDAPASRSRRRDQRTLPWAESIDNRFWTMSGLELTYQPVWSRVASADLIVLQQEAGLLLNYWALARARLGGPPVALWGHGHNFNRVEANAPAEWVKAKVTPLADWFFAYTERSADVFRSIGVPDERMTVVQNTIDVSWYDRRPGPEPVTVPSQEVEHLVDQVVAREARVGWIVSALDRWKRVPFLVEVLDAVRERVPDFEFFAVGAGSEAGLIVDAARSRPWLHATGPLFGADKAAVARVAEITIHPGLIGLHVIDAFATATPMVTAALPYHSHEVDYLESGTNAVVLPEGASADELAAASAELLTDRRLLGELQAGCRKASTIYTLEVMVDRFAAGIRCALTRPRRGDHRSTADSSGAR